MELYFVLAIVDRAREPQLQILCRELELTVVLTERGQGTATQSHLRLHDLQPTEKSVVEVLTTGSSMRRLLRAAKRVMYMDIPGNGIMLAIPVKSVSGKKTLAYITKGQEVEGTVPSMEFKNELIVVVLNEGHTDTVMDAARGAGATGGTVLHAKGTGGRKAAKFLGMSVAEEKDMIYILAPSDKKSQIMKAIHSHCGPGTKPGAICFSLPVSETVGIRRLDDDSE